MNSENVWENGISLNYSEEIIKTYNNNQIKFKSLRGCSKHNTYNWVPPLREAVIKSKINNAWSVKREMRATKLYA